MENKKLNEQELEQVTGGHAVLPLLSSEAPEVGEQGEPAPVSIPKIRAYCMSCKMYFGSNVEVCSQCGGPLTKL